MSQKKKREKKKVGRLMGKGRKVSAESHHGFVGVWIHIQGWTLRRWSRSWAVEESLFFLMPPRRSDPRVSFPPPGRVTQFFARSVGLFFFFFFFFFKSGSDFTLFYAVLSSVTVSRNRPERRLWAPLLSPIVTVQYRVCICVVSGSIVVVVGGDTRM